MNGNFISYGDAAEMTARFRANQDTILADAYKGKGILYRCETFDKAWFTQLLNQDGAAGLRVYIGMDENLETRAIIVAVDAVGHDIVPLLGAAAAAGGYVLEEGQRCPTNCPPPPPSGL